MRYITTIILFLALPVFAGAQFNGFQDQTVTDTYWSSESGYVSGNIDTFTGSTDIPTAEQNFVGNDQSINANIGTGQCSVSDYSVNGSRTLASYVNYIGCLVRVSVLPFIMAIAVLSFVWGVVQMIMNPANEEAQSKGRTFILWGILGFFIITAMYSLVAVIRRTVGFGFTAKNDATPYTQLKEKVMNVK